MTHPKTIDAISAPWLTDVLRDAGVLQRATVKAVDVQAIGQGVGFLSGRARVTISYDQADDGVPATVVVKVPASIKAGADFAKSMHAYEREIGSIARWRRARRSGCHACSPRSWNRRTTSSSW